MQLVIVNGDFKGKVFPLQSGSNLIGRWDPDTGSFPEIDLDELDVDAKISRKHTVVIVTETGVFVEDVGSLNGTFLTKAPDVPLVKQAAKDPVRLESGKKIELQAGDEILVGRIQMRFEV